MYADDDLGDFWLRSRTAANARGSLFAALSVNAWEGVWRWRKGELAEAAALIEDAVEHDQMWGGSGVGLAYSHGALVAITLDRGDAAGARQLLDTAPSEALHGDGGRLFRQVAAGVFLAERRFAAALDTIDAIGDPVGIRNPAWNPWRRLRAPGAPRPGTVRRGLGADRGGGPPTAPVGGAELAGIRSHRPWAGQRRLGAAAGGDSSSGGSGAQLLLSRARLALGRHPAMPPGDAATYLRAALDSAVACAADGVAGQACAALKRLGQPAPDIRTRRSSEAIQ